MGSGRSDREGQRLRRERLAAFIRERGKCRGGELCAAFSLSRSSLSDDLRAILRQDPSITSPRRGVYLYAPKGAGSGKEAGAGLQNAAGAEKTADVEKTAGAPGIRAAIDAASVRQWMILALLLDRSLGRDALLCALRDAGVSCGMTTLKKDLLTLRATGHVTAQKEGKRLLYRSLPLCPVSAEEIASYEKDRASRAYTARMRFGAGGSIDEQLLHVKPSALSPSVSPDTGGAALFLAGRRNNVDPASLLLFERLRALSLDRHPTAVTWETRRDGVVTEEFYTGLFVYSAETFRIYLLGKTKAGRNLVIPADAVLAERTLVHQKEENPHFESPEFFAIFREMFTISVEEPVTAEVRFADTRFVREKVRRLAAARPGSSLSESPDGSFLLYADRIRGIDSFARYLRRFGRAALAVSPPALAERMADSARRVRDLYAPETGQEGGAENGAY